MEMNNIPFTNTITDPDSLVTLKPFSFENGVADYRDMSGSMVGAKRCTISAKLTNRGRVPMSEERIASYAPTLETLGTNDAGIVPPAQVKDVAWVETIYHFPQSATPEQRAALKRQHEDCQLATEWVALVTTGERVRG